MAQRPNLFFSERRLQKPRSQTPKLYWVRVSEKISGLGNCKCRNARICNSWDDINDPKMRVLTIGVTTPEKIQFMKPMSLGCSVVTPTWYFMSSWTYGNQKSRLMSDYVQLCSDSCRDEWERQSLKSTWTHMHLCPDSNTRNVYIIKLHLTLKFKNFNV